LLGATADRVAVPPLVLLAGHGDPDVRFQVPLSLPSVWSGDPDGPDVQALIRLTADIDAEVRDWATFGLGTQLTDADTAAIRAALRNRTSDDHPGTREEAICGLACRRDPRAISLVGGLLAAEDGAHLLVFEAAEVLGAAELVPLLEESDADDHGVREALAGCDPAARDRRDQFAWDLLCTLYRQQPGIDACACATPPNRSRPDDQCRRNRAHLVR
jgi:HEAT repeat protein